MRYLIALLILTALGVTLPAGLAASYYQTTKTVVGESKQRGLQRIVKELRNSSNRPISYDYDVEKEKCWRWSISASVMSRFGFSGSQEGCRTTGTYSTSGRLDPGKTLRVLGQSIREYTTYLAQRIRVWDDGRYEVIDRTYATLKEDYEQYWRSIINH